MNEQKIVSIIKENRDEFRKIFLHEWESLNSQKVRVKGYSYRSDYINEIDKEFEKSLDQYMAIHVEKRIDFKTLKDKILKAIEYGVWKVACKLKTDNTNEGEPKKEVVDFFNSGQLGETLIDQLIIKVFTAIGLIWGAFPALIGSEIGKAVVKWVNGRIVAKCDEILEKKATAFCKIPVEEPK